MEASRVTLDTTVYAHLLTFDRDFDKLERLEHTCFDASSV